VGGASYACACGRGAQSIPVTAAARPPHALTLSMVAMSQLRLNRALSAHKWPHRQAWGAWRGQALKHGTSVLTGQAPRRETCRATCGWEVYSAWSHAFKAPCDVFPNQLHFDTTPSKTRWLSAISHAQQQRSGGGGHATALNCRLKGWSATRCPSADVPSMRLSCSREVMWSAGMRFRGRDSSLAASPA